MNDRVRVDFTLQQAEAAVIALRHALNSGAFASRQYQQACVDAVIAVRDEMRRVAKDVA